MYGLQEAVQAERGAGDNHGHRRCPPAPRHAAVRPGGSHHQGLLLCHHIKGEVERERKGNGRRGLGQR